MNCWFIKTLSWLWNFDLSKQKMRKFIPFNVYKKHTNRIYELRGERVMLDFDLADLYKVETRVLNQAVKRNIEQFPSDFMFRLKSCEFESIRLQIDAIKKVHHHKLWWSVVCLLEADRMHASLCFIKAYGNYFWKNSRCLRTKKISTQKKSGADNFCIRIFTFPHLKSCHRRQSNDRAGIKAHMYCSFCWNLL